ncbi:serine/threonine-protein kinase [Mycolicibacterium sp. 120270]|uniref:serine/threonine-protein kinase n=1 Tax=Mycolicibacterium sp. 120270 TaxID=3090600 RepID=UPI00299E3AAC|nr:serine/threonine-protein kinase [Mycolicibacterium sp. 120270]MDX1887378.1 serine/threonine-protein kinase [Mycolicibacterium sp. 120270]
MSGTEGDSRVGTVFGRYRLRRLLGRGGMGEVYEAEDTEKDRIVALKLLPEAVSHDPVFRKRLQREAHSAGRLLEPHVVPIHDYGEIDGVMFVDMRMIDGTDLRKILKNYGPMTPARAVAIVRQIASALDAAHESGIMHRDVKPENILITRDDFAYLVDFGIANAATDEKLTELGTAVGTYAYMAPERFSNDQVTYRADIYALACVLHECLTGSQPFPADSVSAVITAHLMQPVPRPSVMRPGIPGAFDRVIERGMAKNPNDRFASAGDLAAAANDALTQRDQDQAANILQRSQEATMPAFVTPPPYQVTPPPPTPPAFPASSPAGFHGQFHTPPPAGPKHKSTTWIPVAAAAAVFVVVLGAFGVWWVLKKDDSSNRSVAATTSTTGETTTRSRPPRTTATPPPESESFDARLFAVLPASYDEGACEAVHPPATGALATVDCTETNVPTGPRIARYSLFADQKTLDEHFQDAIAQNSELVRCPGSDLDSPTAWFYNANPDEVAGQVACGVYEGNQDVTWTKDADLLLADAQSDNLEDLHKWWNDFG